MNRIKEVLLDQGKTEAWLANQMGVSYVECTNWLNNKTQPTIPQLYQIADLLSVDVRELLVRRKP